MKRDSRLEFHHGPYAVCYKVDGELDYLAEIYDTYPLAMKRYKELDTFGKMIYSVVPSPKEIDVTQPS